jgi:hypothetical protein
MTKNMEDNKQRQQVKYTNGDDTTSAAPCADVIAKLLPFSAGSMETWDHPSQMEWHDVLIVSFDEGNVEARQWQQRQNCDYF